MRQTHSKHRAAAQGYQSRANINLPIQLANTFTCSSAVKPLLVAMGVTISAQGCYWRELRMCNACDVCLGSLLLLLLCCCPQRQCTAAPPTARRTTKTLIIPRKCIFFFSFHQRYCKTILECMILYKQNITSKYDCTRGR